MALAKTKGANLFAIQTMVLMTDEQIPVLTTQLAVALRKKLLVFVWKDTEFSETKVNNNNRMHRVVDISFNQSFYRNLIYLTVSKRWPGSAIPKFVSALRQNMR